MNREETSLDLKIKTKSELFAGATAQIEGNAIMIQD
jgi:hypothetical protein